MLHKTIVIVGGGFAGTYGAQYLEPRLPADWRIILFNQENYLTFTPLLAEVVGSSISPLHVVRPVRQILKHTECRTAPVTGFDFKNSEVEYQLPDGNTARQPYGHLVLACGMIVNTNVIPGVAAHAFPLKTLGDALLLRNRVIRQMEQAEVETNPDHRRHLLSFAVIGGGFSGVEVAGEMFDLLLASRRFYPSLKREDIRVVLIHSQDRILPELPETLGEFARRRMEKRGIEFVMNARAQAVTENGVRLADGKVIPAGTVVCTIGNTVNPLLTASGLPLDHGRLTTEPDMRVPGLANVWALGDCALVPNAKDGKPSPTLAQFALRQARQLARNLAGVLAGRPTRPFSFGMLGSFAAIGHHNAVGLVFGLKFSGVFAWFLWRAIYLSKMPTFARKVQVAFDWACDLFFPRDIVELNATQTKRIPRAHYEQGEYLFHQGDIADKFYIVERGQVGIYIQGWDDPVWTIHAGEHFGDYAMLEGGRRATTARALEAVDVLAMSRDAFVDLINHLAPLRTRMTDIRLRQEAKFRFRAVFSQNPRLNTLRVREAMTTPVPTLTTTLTLGEAIGRLHAEREGAYAVVDEQGRLQGICSGTDLERALISLKPLTTPVGDIMARPVLSVSEGRSFSEALPVFLDHPVKRLVVVAENDPARPVGMLTPFDILLHFARSPGDNSVYSKPPGN